MLALGLVALEVVEIGVAWLLASRWHDAGLSWPLALAGVFMLALSWRAVLVLATFRLAGLGWPTPRLWADESLAFSRAYLAMTMDPLWRVLDALRWPAHHGASPEVTPAAPGSAAARGGTMEPRLVLVHGWCCNGGVWRPLLRAWHHAGRRRPERVTLAPVLGDIDRMARQLDRQIGGMDRRSGAIYLVAHSMGGVVVRRWLQLRGPGPEVAGLMTIGTPHGGSTLARWGGGEAARQLRPGSAWLQRLDAAPTVVPTTCVWSRVDNFVSPAASARLPGAESVEFTGRAHFGMLRDRALPELLLRTVATGAAWPVAASGTGKA